MPNCYACGKETPVTNFYLLRIYYDKKGKYTEWFYACPNKRHLHDVALDKAFYDQTSFLLREYRGNHGRAWRFENKTELMDFIDRLAF